MERQFCKNMNFNDFNTIITSVFGDIEPSVLEKFQMMEALYKEWNAKINVISRKDIDSLYLHHVLHSLAIAAFIKEKMPETFETMRKGSCGDDENGTNDAEKGRKISILDLGTGGGFPGIPLATLFPNARFTLCDSIGKKITVASAVAQSLGLENVNTVNARAESLDENFDFIVSRAVTALDNFMPWVKGKYKNGIIYLKGGDINEELASACAKKLIKLNKVQVHSISKWFKDGYFNEKLVIFIENNLQLN